MEERSEVNISKLLIRLYEKNKEHLMLSRQDIRSSADIAEVSLLENINLNETIPTIFFKLLKPS